MLLIIALIFVGGAAAYVVMSFRHGLVGVALATLLGAMVVIGLSFIITGGTTIELIAPGIIAALSVAIYLR